MPRPLRPVAPGLIYHVLNRGNNRQQVFFDEGDYLAFLKALSDLQERKPFELYGYCLMQNHFHLLIKPLQDNISRIMQSLTVSHTQRYHRYRSSGGHVWQGRFKSPVIQDDDHLLTVLRYIERNPIRANIVRLAKNYRWSSFRHHGMGEANEILVSCTPYTHLAKQATTRQRRWNAYVHEKPDDEELAAIRRSANSSLPYGNSNWVKRLAKSLDLDLTIRARGRPKKASK